MRITLRLDIIEKKQKNDLNLSVISKRLYLNEKLLSYNYSCSFDLPVMKIRNFR